MRLDPAAFTETTPIVQPTTAFDQLKAWKGPHPHLLNTTLVVQAAWREGRIVRASILYPWEQRAATGNQQRASVDLASIWLPTLMGIATFFVILLALRNWKKQRADRQGAFRIGIAVFVLSAIKWAGAMHPIADRGMLDLATAAAADWLMDGVTLALIYLALEPEVRARWPHSIVTWNRVLAGRWWDAQVGSHILIGAAVGTGLWIVFKTVAIVVFGTNEPSNWDISLHYLLGTRQWIGANAGNIASAMGKGIMAFLTIFAMRHILRRDWLAALAAAALFTLAQEEVRASNSIPLGLLFFSIFAAITFVLLRCGLVASIAAVFFADSMNGIPLGGDWSAWYLPASIATVLLLMGIATFAFWRSLGGRELLEGDIT
jgi:serine/threonine-protein kinase